MRTIAYLKLKENTDYLPKGYITQFCFTDEVDQKHWNDWDTCREDEFEALFANNEKILPPFLKEQNDRIAKDMEEMEKQVKL